MKEQIIHAPYSWRTYPKDYQVAVQEWLHRHDIDPSDLYYTEAVIVKGDVIHYTKLIRNESGEPKQGTNTFTGKMCFYGEELTAPLLEPPPLLPKQ